MYHKRQKEIRTIFLNEEERERKLGEIIAALSELESQMNELERIRDIEQEHVLEEQERARVVRADVDERVENLNERIALLRRLISMISK